MALIPVIEDVQKMPDCQVWFTLGVKVHKMGSELYRLVEQPWLQLMCYAVCLLYGCNFRE